MLAAGLSGMFVELAGASQILEVLCPSTPPLYAHVCGNGQSAQITSQATGNIVAIA